jgi:type VI secretion system Hcp family effector
MNFTEKSKNYTLVLVLSLVLSMLFVGINGFSNANNAGLETSQVELDQTAGTNLPVIGFASIEVNGLVLSGDTTIPIIGGEDTTDYIEFLTYRHDMSRSNGDGSRAISGRIVHSPIIITKRIDGTSPLLIQGLHQNQDVEGVFRFFDSDPNTGVTRLRYTVAIIGGRITSVRTLTILDQGITHLIEEVSFAYQTITFTDDITGTSYEYNWDQQA